MTKINFDYTRLSNNVIPSLEGCREKINSAIKTIDNTYIPGDCKYYSYLKELDIYLLGIGQNITRAKEWLQKCNSDLEDTMDSATQTISNIEIVEIEKK